MKVDNEIKLFLKIAIGFIVLYGIYNMCLVEHKTNLSTDDLKWFANYSEKD